MKIHILIGGPAVSGIDSVHAVVQIEVNDCLDEKGERAGRRLDLRPLRGSDPLHNFLLSKHFYFYLLRKLLIRGFEKRLRGFKFNGFNSIKERESTIFN